MGQLIIFEELGSGRLQLSGAHGSEFLGNPSQADPIGNVNVGEDDMQQFEWKL
jgi:hypothetical protein